VIKGLNIEGVCLSKHCEAYKKCVIAGLGMVSFCLHADVVNCPECHMQIQPRTCAFYECMWGFDGRKSESGGPKDVSNAWTEASGGMYHRFQEQNNTVKWHFLVLTARPLAMKRRRAPALSAGIASLQTTASRRAATNSMTHA
jgi:hypothetical protein